MLSINYKLITFCCLKCPKASVTISYFHTKVDLFFWDNKEVTVFCPSVCLGNSNVFAIQINLIGHISDKVVLCKILCDSLSTLVTG